MTNTVPSLVERIRAHQIESEKAAERAEAEHLKKKAESYERGRKWAESAEVRDLETA